MAEFLVELYISRVDPDAVGRDVERARRAAVELTAEGTPVRFLRSIFIPAEETCFFLYEAHSVDAVHEAVHRAGLAHEHVAETAAHISTEENPRR
jgi:Protein of unknown function (DUF4242)